MKYKVRMQLLSETIFGAGSSVNGSVNNDLLIDRDGFPYLMGKTFKGYIRQSANDFLKPVIDENDFEQFMGKIFGTDTQRNVDDNIRIEERAGAARFSNLYLNKSIKDIFKEDDSKLEVLTDIRYSTRIGDTGTAEDGSLRTSRVLRRNLEFTGQIDLNEELHDYEKKYFELCISATKNVGMNKSRGKGLVNIEITEGEIDIKKSKGEEKRKHDFIYYELFLEEPIKIGNNMNQEDFQESKSYITGSAIRGAMISKYIKQNNVAQNELEHDHGFNEILNKVSFFDAYPLLENKDGKKYSFPTPGIFRISKDVDKKSISEYNKEDFTNILVEKETVGERRVVKLKKGEFSYLNNDELVQFNVKKITNMHHTKSKDEKNLFRYEAIERGQKFYGIIDQSEMDHECRNILFELLSREDVIYIGGARTAGYGKCKISAVKGKDSFKKLCKSISLTDHEKSSEVYNIYFLSDSLLRNKYFESVNKFSEQYLKDELGVQVKYREADIDKTILTGYNVKWNSHVPHETGIKSGSVISYAGKLDNESLEQFMFKQHGDRISEGLGRVLINPKFLYANRIRYEEDMEYTINEENEQDIHKEVLDKLKKEIKESKINKKIDEYIVSNIKRIEIEKEKLGKSSNTLVNKIVDMIEKLKFEEHPFESFKENLKAFGKRSENNAKNIRRNSLMSIEIIDGKRLNDLKDIDIGKIDGLLQSIDIVEELDESEKEKVLLRVVQKIFYYMRLGGRVDGK